VPLILKEAAESKMGKHHELPMLTVNGLHAWVRRQESLRLGLANLVEHCLIRWRYQGKAIGSTKKSKKKLRESSTTLGLSGVEDAAPHRSPASLPSSTQIRSVAYSKKKKTWCVAFISLGLARQISESGVLGCLFQKPRRGSLLGIIG
jgi:hypothetical protein